METDECKCGHERSEHEEEKCNATFPSEHYGAMWERCDCEGFEGSGPVVESKTHCV